jgi:hypothetical protein
MRSLKRKFFAILECLINRCRIYRSDLINSEVGKFLRFSKSRSH